MLSSHISQHCTALMEPFWSLFFFHFLLMMNTLYIKLRFNTITSIRYIRIASYFCADVASNDGSCIISAPVSVCGRFLMFFSAKCQLMQWNHVKWHPHAVWLSSFPSGLSTLTPHDNLLTETSGKYLSFGGASMFLMSHVKGAVERNCLQRKKIKITSYHKSR